MANKKISQLSGISPVPTGALVVVANSGVSRSATVKDMASAIASTNNSFSGLLDTPSGITGDMFLVGSPGGNSLTFSKDLNLGTGTFLDKKTGGTISGTVTMATGEKIQFANSNIFINSAGENLAIDANTFLKLKTESGVNIYDQAGSVPKLRFHTGSSDDAVSQQLSIEHARFVMSGAPTGTVITERIDVSGDIYQSGVLIDTGTFALKADTGSFITSLEGTSTNLIQTGHVLSGYIDNVSGNVMNTGANLSGWIADISGKTVYKTETGVFPTGSGVVNYLAKWTGEIDGVGRVLDTGFLIEEGGTSSPGHVHPSAGYVNLGKANTDNRWSGIFAKKLHLEDVATSLISVKNTFTGATSTEILARNSDGNSVSVGISSTGQLSNHIGSGNWFIKGAESGTSGVIANQGDILFFADSGTALQMDTTPIVELKQQVGGVSEIKLNEKVTFSNEFTLPTSDGTANQSLTTDGAGNVSWVSVSSSANTNIIATGNALDAKRDLLSGSLISSGNALDAKRNLLSGDLIQTGIVLSGYSNDISGNLKSTGLFLSGLIEDVSGKVVYTSTTGTVSTPILLDITHSGHLDAKFGDSVNTLTGLLDVNTGVDGNPQFIYGTQGYALVINEHENGVKFSGITAGTSSDTFLELTDTPGSFSSNLGDIVFVHPTSQNIQFHSTGDFLGTVNSGHINDALINSGQSHIDNVASTGDTIVANLITTGTTLTNSISSNTSAIATNTTQITNNTNNLKTTGVTLQTQIDALDNAELSNRLISTGGHLSGYSNEISGALTASGQEITGTIIESGVALSGYSNEISGALHNTGIEVGLLSGQMVTTGEVYSGEYSDYTAEYNVAIVGGQLQIGETPPLHSGEAYTGLTINHGGGANNPTLFLDRGTTYRFNFLSGASNRFFGISTGLNSEGNVGLFSGHFQENNVLASGAVEEGESLFLRIPQASPRVLGYNLFAVRNPVSAADNVSVGGNIITYSNAEAIEANLIDTGNNLEAQIFNTGNTLETKVFNTGNTLETKIFNTGDTLHNAAVLHTQMQGSGFNQNISSGLLVNKYDTNQTITGNLIVSGTSGLAVAGNVEISAGVSYHQVKAAGSTINWSEGNIQYDDNCANTYTFSNVKDGQTLTVYIKNDTSSAQNCTFSFGSPNRVRMPADSAGINTSPQIAPYKTNVYTFVAINTGIFTSYVTGYNYQ